MVFLISAEKLCAVRGHDWVAFTYEAGTDPATDKQYTDPLYALGCARCLWSQAELLSG